MKSDADASLAACQQPLEADTKNRRRKTPRHSTFALYVRASTRPRLPAVRLHYQPLRRAVYMDATLKPCSGSKAPHGQEQPRPAAGGVPCMRTGPGMNREHALKLLPCHSPLPSPSYARMGTMSTSRHMSHGFPFNFTRRRHMMQHRCMVTASTSTSSSKVRVDGHRTARWNGRLFLGGRVFLVRQTGDQRYRYRGTYVSTSV